jgi:hypothetical protein
MNYKTTGTDDELPETRGSRGLSAITVDQCPYCGRSHRHWDGSDPDPLRIRRTADCLRGDYIVVIQAMGEGDHEIN